MIVRVKSDFCRLELSSRYFRFEENIQFTERPLEGFSATEKQLNKVDLRPCTREVGNTPKPNIQSRRQTNIIRKVTERVADQCLPRRTQQDPSNSTRNVSDRSKLGKSTYGERIHHVGVQNSRHDTDHVIPIPGQTDGLGS